MAPAWIATAPPAAYFVVSAIFHYLAIVRRAPVRARRAARRRVAPCCARARRSLWRRPWHALRGRLVVALGVVLAVMNACFYLAIDRLPLGTVAD